MTDFLIKKFVKDHQNTADPKVRTRYGILGGVVGIICNLFLFVIKLSIGLFSGSMSIVADAFNNLSDIGSCAVTLLGFKIANQPPDREHPFGHGRMEYMSAALVSALIVLVGFELLKESFSKILSPEPLKFSYYIIAALVVSVAVKFLMGLFNKKLGKRINSPALGATAADCFSDCIATSTVLLSVLVSHFTALNIDAYAGLVVSALIIYNGVKSIKETLDPLLGMPPEPETVEALEKIVLSYPDFLGIHDLIIHNYGPGRSFASLHVEVPQDVDILECHENIDHCEKTIFEKLGLETVIHMDPIAHDDEYTLDIKEKITAKLKEVDEELSLHDFRIVRGENRTNLIFDVAMPPKFKMTAAELKKAVSQKAREVDDTFVCVITVDTIYTPYNK